MKIIAIRILVNVHRNINFAPSDVNISLNGCALSRMTVIANKKYFGLVEYPRGCHPGPVMPPSTDGGLKDVLSNDGFIDSSWVNILSTLVRKKSPKTPSLAGGCI